MDERGDGGHLVGGPAFELDVRRTGRDGEGTDQNVEAQIKDAEIKKELRKTEKEETCGE